jgi:hypothetical protein
VARAYACNRIRSTMNSCGSLQVPIGERSNSSTGCMTVLTVLLQWIIAGISDSPGRFWDAFGHRGIPELLFLRSDRRLRLPKRR